MTSTNPPDEADFDWAWAEDDPDWVPPGIDITKPSPARMYDYALGGKDNFAVDRAAVEQAAAVLPFYQGLALANRAFLTKAVRQASEAGITQFIDLGTGIPTSPNVHEVAREINPDARVVYVDNDPMVMAHNRARRAVIDGVITTQHDLREPASVLRDRQITELIDFTQPVALLFIAVMHFVRREHAPEIMAQYRKAVAPGSYLALSTACSEGMDPADVARIQAIYQKSAADIHFRSMAEIDRLFEGFELFEPGLKDVTQWRADGTPHTVHVVAGLGRKPE